MLHLVILYFAHICTVPTLIITNHSSYATCPLLNNKVYRRPKGVYWRPKTIRFIHSSHLCLEIIHPLLTILAYRFARHTGAHDGYIGTQNIARFADMHAFLVI